MLEKTIELLPEFVHRGAREAILRYLAAQSSAYPLVAAELLLRVVDSVPLYWGVDSDDEKTILQNVILSGGDAYRVAQGIIERQEMGSGKSLAGLLM